MGCDIHAVFQKKNGDKWEEIPSKYDEDRHYQLFGLLANVRNGYGFAGILTGQEIKPIAEPRGLPKGFEINENQEHIMPEWHKNYDGENKKWMGYHSYSWLIAEEILSYSMIKTWRTGILEIEEFLKWDGISKPSSFCAGVEGKDIFLANNPCTVDKDTTHVRVFWLMGIEEFKYFFDEIKRLKEVYGEVRIVFGFDS